MILIVYQLMSNYDNLTRDELIRRLVNLERENTLLVQQQASGVETFVLDKNLTRQTVTDLLTILLETEEQDKIKQALALLRDHFKVDRAYIAWYYEEKNTMRITDEVTADNLFSIVDDLDDLHEKDMPWWFKQILGGHNIVLPDVEKIPDEAINEKKLLKLQNILSLLVIPLFSNGKPTGFIGLDSVRQYRDWSVLEKENLRTMADIILIALQKRESIQKMQESEQQFRVLYNNMPLAYLRKRVIRDSNNNSIDFKYIDVNAAAERLFNIPKDDFLRSTYYQTAAPIISEDIFSDLLAVKQSKAAIIAEKHININQKLLKLIIYSPSPDEVVTLCFEISNEGLMEEEMLRNEAKFKIVFDKLPVGVELYDAEGRLIDLNQADQKIFGVDRANILGVNIFENPNLPIEQISLLRQGKEADLDFTYNFANIEANNYYNVISKKQNSSLRLFIKCLPLNDINGKIFGYMVIVNDETEKYQKAEETKELFTKLQTAVRYSDSLMWEYDIPSDSMHVDLELKDSDKESKLKVDPFNNKHDFYNVVHPDDREYVCDQHFERLIRGEIGSYYIQYRRLYQDGYIWVKAHVQPYKFNPDGSPNKILYYLTDITDEVDMQTKLRSVEEENRKIVYAVEKSQDEVYALNSNGEFVFTNKRVNENYHLQGNCSNYHVWDINPEYPEERWKNLVSVLRTGENVVQQTVHQRADGSKFPVEIYIYRASEGESELFWCFARDITERIRQQEQIVSLNSMMEAILDNVPVSIVVKDIRNDFNIVFFNRASESFMGKKAKDIIGRNDFHLFEGNIKRAAEVRREDMLAIEQGGSSEYAAKYILPSGEKRIVNAIRIPVQKDEANPVLIGLIWDITEQQQQEVELIKAKEADKLKSTFLANMSHEIRTPLNAIVGFSGIIAETEDFSERQSYIEIINKNCELLLQLIDDILDFSKIESGTLDIHEETVDIKEICYEIYTIHALKMPPEVQLTFDRDLPSILFCSDAKRITQVISNFLTNAKKFTHDGEIKLTYRKIGKKLYVSVSDTGIGISEDKCRSIFERFVKLNDFKQGTGLGLAISKMIIEKLGGEIGVYSTLGKGSTFWFTLPVKNESTEAEAVPVPLSENHRKETVAVPDKKHRILIAEDVEENFHLLEIILKDHYILYHATNGVEAVEMYQKYAPDLILMDIKMPEMDGFEATRIIRGISGSIPILALTAFAHEREKQIAKECNFNEYIIKPINIHQVKEIVNSYFTKDTDL